MITLSEATLKFHNFADAGQAVPVVGPLIASPLKAAISIIQLVVGTILGMITACIGACRHSNKTLNFSASCFEQARQGGSGLAYSLANIFTAGILAYRIKTEELINPFSSEVSLQTPC